MYDCLEFKDINMTEAAVAGSCMVTASETTKPLKPCCACPETKKARDECIILKGEESCSQFIAAHKECMRLHGFQI